MFHFTPRFNSDFLQKEKDGEFLLSETHSLEWEGREKGGRKTEPGGGYGYERQQALARSPNALVTGRHVLHFNHHSHSELRLCVSLQREPCFFDHQKRKHNPKVAFLTLHICHGMGILALGPPFSTDSSHSVTCDGEGGGTGRPVEPGVVGFSPQTPPTAGPSRQMELPARLLHSKLQK